MNKIFSFAKVSHATLITVLLIFSFFLLKFGNSTVALTHPDEVFYMETAKEMIQHQSWLTPMIFDQPQFEKPILFYWLLISSIKTFGLTPLAARFWSALFGMLGVGLVYWISWMLFRKKRISFLSGMILSSSFIHLAMSRAGLTDMTFSMLVVATIGCFYAAWQNQTKRDFYLITGFIIMGLAVLTKGVLGITFTVTTTGILLWIQKDFSLLKSKALWIGLLLFLAIALPWHILMYKWHGSAFVDEYWRNVHIRRIFETEHPKINTWYFYPGLMFAGVLPWSLFWIPVIGAVFNKIKERAKESRSVLFLIGWIFSVLLYTQPAQAKLASYILPAFAAIAILIAFYLDQALEGVKEGKKAIMMPIVGHLISLLLIGVAVGGVYFAHKYLPIIKSATPAYVTAVLTVVLAGVIFFLNIRKQYFKMLLSVASVTLLVLVMTFLATPYVEPWVSCKQVCDVFKTIDDSDTPVLASKFYVRAVRYFTDRKMAVIDINGSGFYSPHPIPFLNTDQKVIEFLSQRPVTYAVVKDGNVEDLERILSGRPYAVEQLYGDAGKFILRITRK